MVRRRQALNSAVWLEGIEPSHEAINGQLPVGRLTGNNELLVAPGDFAGLIRASRTEYSPRRGQQGHWPALTWVATISPCFQSE
jgi:hypothetical protein